MKFKNPQTGQFQELYFRTLDSLPVGSIVDYAGDTVPDGWVEVTDEKQFVGKVLYNNSSGATGTITLSESKNNFDFLEIFFLCNTYGSKSVKVLTTADKVVLDYSALANNLTNQISSSVFTLNNNSLTYLNSMMINIQTSGSIASEQGNDLIKITKIIGYKEV